MEKCKRRHYSIHTMDVFIGHTENLYFKLNWRQDQCFSSLMKFLFQVLGKNVKGSIPSQFSCIEVCRMLGNFPHLLPSHFYFFISLFTSLCSSVSFSSSFNYWHIAPCTVIFAFPWYVRFFFFLKTLMYLSVWPTVWILLNMPYSAPLQFFLIRYSPVQFCMWISFSPPCTAAMLAGVSHEEVSVGSYLVNLDFKCFCFLPPCF